MVREKKNYWKIAFLSSIFSLFIVVVIVISSFFAMFPTKLNSPYEPHLSQNEETLFVISTTKDRLNQFLREQLERNHQNNFRFFLTDVVVFESVLPVFGRDVAIMLELQPELLDDGTIILKGNDFQLGMLELPAELLFRIIENTIEFPDWISINSSESMIYLHTTKIESLETLSIKVTKFDLLNDKIEMQLLSKQK